MKRLLVVSSVLAIGLIASCKLLPERFAVNAPMFQQIFGTAGTPASASRLQESIDLPQGFSIGVFADGIRPRMLRFTTSGDLLVSAPRDGSILWLAADRDGDGRSDGVRTLLSDLDRPNGIDVHNGWLYVAEGSAVGRIRFDASTGETLGSYQRLVDGLPSGGNHWTRTLRVGPDDYVYVSIGSSCNVCEEEDSRRAAIIRFRLDGSGEEIFASGLRNAVGFDWRPESGELYATDNGRDLLGNDFPPCELNRVVAGGFYGWPYANGDRVPDPDLGEGHEREIQESISPEHDFRAHNAPLGIAFVQEKAAPVAYRGAALVALHGSWNRTRKDGYKVVSLHWDENGDIEERDFAVGFENDEEVIGRPVDVAVGPDGAFYVSDDYARAIYRIAKGAPPSPSSASPVPAAPARPQAPELASASDDQARARGLVLYESLACYGCHEIARANAGTIAIPLEERIREREIAEIADFLKAPTPPMPAYDLDALQRRDLATYLVESTR